MPFLPMEHKDFANSSGRRNGGEELLSIEILIQKAVLKFEIEIGKVSISDTHWTDWLDLSIADTGLHWEYSMDVHVDLLIDQEIKCNSCRKTRTPTVV